MPQYVVPQFIDVEDKILGPLTVRQFGIIMADFFMMFIVYKLADIALTLLIDLPLLAGGIILAFVKVNGVPFHFFMLNVFQTMKRNPIRVWNKEVSDAELVALTQVEVKIVPPPIARKEAIQSSRLNQLALVVNTGGVYNPDEE